MTVSDTKAFWQRTGAAGSYDNEFQNMTGWYVDQSETRPFRDLLGAVRGATVLDVGCGTGRHLLLFNPGNELTGVDLSSEMLARASEKVPGAHFLVSSADPLPFKDGSFDVVISARVIQHVRDQKKFIGEMARVCKPGGKVVLLCYNSWSLLCLYKQLRMSRLGRWLNIPFKLILGRRSFLNPWGFSYDNYCSAPEITKWMAGSGVKAETLWGVTLGPSWFWNDFFLGKIMEKTMPNFYRGLLEFFLWTDRVFARRRPLNYFSEKLLWVGVKI